MEKYDAEITALGERIMKYCPDQNICLEATSRLAFNHCEMGRKEIGKAVYETLPSSKFCKENQEWCSSERLSKAFAAIAPQFKCSFVSQIGQLFIVI